MKQKKRYLEFDIVRTVTLILLPFSHTAESGHNMEVLKETPLLTNPLVLKIASFGVMVFMLLLGVNILLTTHNSPKRFLKRGLTILLLGLGLNVIRYIIPGFLGTLARDDPAYFHFCVIFSIASDILYFSAFCFFFFALVRKLKLPPFVIFLIGCALSIIDGLIPDFKVENEYLSAFLGNFIHVDSYSAFAFTQWLVVPCLGYLFGDIYLKAKEKNLIDSFYPLLIVISPVVFIFILILMNAAGVDPMDVIGCQALSYNLELSGVFLMFFAFTFILAIIYEITKLIKGKRVIAFFTDFSRGITFYYLIQWVLVCWSILILGVIGAGETFYIGNIGYVILTVGVIIASYVLTMLRMKRKRRKAATE